MNHPTQGTRAWLRSATIRVTLCAAACVSCGRAAGPVAPRTYTDAGSNANADSSAGSDAGSDTDSNSSANADADAVPEPVPGTDPSPNPSTDSPGSSPSDPGADPDAWGPANVRVGNPFEGARFYVNPEYVQKIEASMGRAPRELRAAMEKAKTNPTAVWLDRIAAIDGEPGRNGVRWHLSAAVSQGKQTTTADGAPMLVMFVIYDLPNRDCAAFASNGELQLAQDGPRRYREDYIDAIVDEVTSNAAYKSLRIVTIIEPDSLPNLVTNLGMYSACRDAAEGYKAGVAYAISRLAELDNVYVYLDIGHSGWLGWEHPASAAQLYREVIQSAGGMDKIRGFATNVANYSTLQEAFDPYVDVNRNRTLIEGFFQWNRIIDELTFVNELRGHFPDKGFIIDTSRNGWKPRGAELPLDSRMHRGNWCNIQHAGLGERPRSSPVPGVDAYYYIKPPGESDGTSASTASTANDEGKRYDKMCGQQSVVRPYSNNQPLDTDSLPDAPHAGHWFDAQFQMLVENASPGL